MNLVSLDDWKMGKNIECEYKGGARCVFNEDVIVSLVAFCAYFVYSINVSCFLV